MNRQRKIKSLLGLHSVGKKILLLTKLIALFSIAIYFFMLHLPVTADVKDIVFFFLVMAMVLTVDSALHYMITKPIRELDETAGRMAGLDFSQKCIIHTKDEFGILSDNLNIMAGNLQNALAQRKDLTDTLSHEMKTPLSVIRSYTEGIRDNEDIEKQAQYIDVIIEETEKMTGMINALLDLSALEAGAASLIPEHFDIVELVEITAGRLFMDTPDNAFLFSYELPDDSVYVTADSKRIEQVLNNLMGNAKKFAAPQGNIRLKLMADCKNIYFRIYNDGQSICDEDLPNIWKKFYRDKSNKNNSGSGLGLTISAQILAMHKAEYGVVNIDTGVEFYFRLPIAL